MMQGEKKLIVLRLIIEKYQTIKFWRNQITEESNGAQVQGINYPIHIKIILSMLKIKDSFMEIGQKTTSTSSADFWIF